jgi:hypothetical protein
MMSQLTLAAAAGADAVALADADAVGQSVEVADVLGSGAAVVLVVTDTDGVADGGARCRPPCGRESDILVADTADVVPAAADADEVADADGVTDGDRGRVTDADADGVTAAVAGEAEEVAGATLEAAPPDTVLFDTVPFDTVPLDVVAQAPAILAASSEPLEFGANSSPTTTPTRRAPAVIEAIHAIRFRDWSPKR